MRFGGGGLLQKGWGWGGLPPILLVDFNLKCFSLAKKTFFTLKSDPFFARGFSKTIFLGFRKSDCTQLRQQCATLTLDRSTQSSNPGTG